MKKCLKIIYIAGIFVCLAQHAFADTNNKVIITNNDPNSGPMTITYKVLHNSSKQESESDIPVTIVVNQDTAISVINKESQTVTFIPVSVNGHEISSNKDEHAIVKKREACAVTLDNKHLVAKISFNQVLQKRGGSYISCTTDNGLVA